MKTENVSTLKIHKLTQEQYDRELAAGNIDETALYLTPDENIDIIKDENGESILITDSADAKIQSLKLFGKSEQKTTTGAQLFGIELITIYQEQCSMADDGYIEVVNNSEYQQYPICQPVYTTGDYTLSVDIADATGGAAVYFMNNGDDYSQPIRESGVYTKTFTDFMWILFAIPSGCSMKARLMLNKGTEALPWEPYTGGIASPNPAYPQEIVSTGVSGSVDINVYGKNLFDYDTYIKTRNITFKVIGGKTLYRNGNLGGIACYKIYDKSNVLMGSFEDYEFMATKPMVLPDNASYIVVDGDPALTPELYIGYDSDTTYEPYNAQTLTVQTPNSLPAIKVDNPDLATYIDSDGQMWCSDEIDFERGVYVKRVHTQVFNGTEFWGDYRSSENTDTYFGFVCGDEYRSKECIDMCTFLHRGSATTEGYYPNTYLKHRDGNIYIRIEIDGVTSVDTFKEWLTANPQAIMYALATPIETPLSSAELAAYKSLRTNNNVTTIMNSDNVHMEMEYVKEELGKDVARIVEHETRVLDEFVRDLKTFSIIDYNAHENCNNLPLGSITYTYGNTEKNDPFEGGIGIVFTYGTATNWHVNQLAMRNDKKEIKFRTCSSGNWTDWEGISTTDDLDALKTQLGNLDNLQTTNKADLVVAINEVRNAISAGGTEAAVTMSASDKNGGKSYTIKQGSNAIGTIDVPKDVTGDIIGSMGEIVANTDANKIPGALPFKDLYQQVKNIRYQYIEEPYDSGLTHMQIVKNHWSEMEYGMYLATIVCGSERLAIIQKYHGDLWGSVFLFGYSVLPEYSYLENGVWRDRGEVAFDAQLANYLPLKGENLGSGDANTCTTSGTITIGTPANWSNLPVVAHGILETFNAGYYILQRYSAGGNPRRIYYRYSGSNGDWWSDWDEFAMKADLKELDTQLGSICYKEFYEPNSSHIDVIKNNWSSLPSGILLIKVISSTTQVAWAYKHDNNYGSVRFTGYFVEREYYYLLQNGTWTIKVENARMSDLADYLPLTGGFMNGNIIPDADNQRYLGFPSSAWLAVYANNLMLAKNNVNYGHMQLVEGTTSTEGLGILNLGNSTPKGTVGNAIGQIRFYNSLSGYTALTPGASKSIALNLPSESGTLLCSADKPTGTYTGNGDKTSRQISIGGIGRSLVIDSSEGMAIVSDGGYIALGSNDTIYGSRTNAFFRRGVLYIANANDALNANGVTYNYAVL